MLARQHERIGHPGHWQMSKRFAPAVTGRLHVHQAGIKFVLHVAHQHTVFYQNRLLGGRTLIINA